MKKRETIIAAIWMLFGLTVAIWSSTFPFGSRKSLGPAFLPFILGVIIVFFGTILFFQSLFSKKEKIFAPIVPKGTALTRVSLTLGGMLVAALLFDLVGFILSVFCLILLLFRIIEPKKWRTDLFYVTVFTFGSYLLFHLLLKVELPRGILGF